ncbi:small ribosomal subunit protein eS7-like [Convolutriloba macropyga]|uniref:small ribosomal subunit protein eS7-like n=1 Tax=Convolutriloba macropyga TaxID=536237 RepID=UPI003F521E10
MAQMLKKKTDPTAFELDIAKIFEKTELGLGHLYFNSAKEIELADGKKVVVIYFPMPLIDDWRKVITKVVNELEKKLQGRSVFFVGNRTILKKEKRGMFKPKGLQKRPRNRTLFAVYDEILADLVRPGLIVGKRTNYTPAGTYIKVFVSKQHQNALESKVETISALYKKLTNRTVYFSFDN